MKEFYEDFIKMQAEMPAILKSKQGQAGQGKFRYADLTEIVETIRPILAKYGFAFMQPLQEYDDKGVCLETILIHKSGEKLATTAVISFQGDDIKKFGAAITYYRRYALQSLLGIVADIDADDIAETIAKRVATPASDEDKLAMFYNQNAQGYNLADVKNFFNARSGYNKRSVSQNIDDFIGKPEAFLKELNSWLSKQPPPHGKGVI